MDIEDVFGCALVAACCTALLALLLLGSWLWVNFSEGRMCAVSFNGKIEQHKQYLVRTSSTGDATTLKIYDSFLRIRKRVIVSKDISVTCE